MPATATATVQVPTAIHAAAARPSASGFCAPDTVAVYAAGDGAVLAATDGKMLAVVPTHAPGASGRTVLPAAVVKSARPSARKAFPAVIDLDANAVPDAKFPPVHDVMAPPMNHRTAVHLNAEMLARLADALGSTDGVVTLLIHADSDKPIVVMPYAEKPGGTGAVGLIMPCSHRYAASVHAGNATERLNDAASVIRAAMP
jgi:hypothetical protein